MPDSPRRASSVQALVPVSYTDGFVVSSMYLVSGTAARRFLPHNGLQPLVLTGNRSPVFLTLFDFRATSIGPYREVSLGIVVSPFGARYRNLLQVVTGSAAVGAWVVALPVTSELACRGGIELFGYPKTMSCIDLNLTPNSCSYVVRDGVKELLSVQLPLGIGLPIPVRRLVTYTQLRGGLRRTTIPIRWIPKLSGCHGSHVHIANDSALGSAIRGLELPAEPTFVLHGGGFQGTLGLSEAFQSGVP